MPRRGKKQLTVIVNPNAGRLSDQVRKDVVAELRARFDVDAHATTARDTGIRIASEIAQAGARVVVAFGGDGHVNEIANGVAGTESALGIIPGGTMNVFARALGIPLDPRGAIDHLERVLSRPPRTVPLGKMNDRYFTFSAGCGFDAEAAERVERYVPAKRRFGEVFFYWSAFRVLAGSFRNRAPTMTLEGPFGTVKVAMAIASNAGPYAYFVGRPVNVAPRVRLEGGIDVFALKTMRLEALPLYAWRVAVSGDIVDHPDAFYQPDLEHFEVSAEEPFSRHVDGEPLSPTRRARFSIEPDALRVLAT
ncbi:MAG: diacylglycerol kinase family lipid kinase [Actinomycetota bacterium]|nr:diacylglycerol kinase family lipid kinase [Actinomycetota bacterium]